MSGIDDLERCITILDRHNWDVETAIHDHLGLDPREVTPPVREIPRFPPPNGQAAVHRPFFERNTQRPQPVDSILQRIMTFFFNPFLEGNMGLWPMPNQRPQGFTGWLLFISALPLRVVVVTFYQFTNFVLKLIRPEHRPGLSQLFLHHFCLFNLFSTYSFNRSNRKCNILHSGI